MNELRKITLPLNYRAAHSLDTLHSIQIKITCASNLLMMPARWSGRRSGISFWMSLSDIPLAEALARAKILKKNSLEH
jgi:hypothetical protein